MRESDRLIAEFTENYTEKVFYFCLRKTGERQHAEDLTQDIALSIFTELRRGVKVDNFPAWVWQIARNRYAKWVDASRRKAESESGFDIGDCEVADPQPLEEELLHEEEISLLRRELAFISLDYQRIVVAYYIDDRSVKDIARTLSLPEGTVKSKLFRARNILKEGMAMAREFGVLSYKPENIIFSMNGSQGELGEPWSIITHALYKNILLAAYRAPSTAEELAVELGVALPYMADELAFLERSTLLKKNGDRYETNFFIISAGAQEKILRHLAEITPAFTEACIRALEYRTQCLEKNGIRWHGGYQDYEDMKWTLLMMLTDEVQYDIRDSLLKEREEDTGKLAKSGWTKRPNGGAWDLCGREDCHAVTPAFVGLHGCNHDEKHFVDFGQYKFHYHGISAQTSPFLTYEEGATLLSFSRGEMENLSPEVLESLCNHGYLKKDGEGYTPTLAVLYGVPKRSKLGDSLSEEQYTEYTRLCREAREIAASHYAFCREQIHREIPTFLRHDTHQINNACDSSVKLRGAVLEEALRTGYISYADGKDEARSRMLGAYIVL